MEEDLLNGPKKSLKKSTAKKEKKPAPPLSKRQELNNHIVCMRKSVRQARVQIINRLISQIQKYKKRKGNPKEQEKAKRKADRILEEIQILKKIKKDKVSLYALQDTQKLEEVLNNPGSTTEERVLARLSHHNVIIKDVQKYRVPNPNWDKQIPVLLEMTREKRRKKKEPVNPAEVQAPAIKRPQKKDSKTDDSESDNDEKPDDLESASSSSDAEEKEAKFHSDNEEIEEKEFKQPIAKLNVRNQKNKKDKQESVEAKIKPVDTVQKSSSQTPVINKSEGTVKVKFLTDLNDLEEDSFEQGSSKNPVDITRATQVKRPKSAFFVGGVDEPERDPLAQDFRESSKSFQKSSEFNQNHHNNGQSKPVYKKGKLISKPFASNRPQGNFGQSRKGPQPFFRGDKQADNRFGGNNAEPLGVKKPRFSTDHQQDRLLKPPQNGTPTVAAEKLHPSWEAKKKQQQISLTEFKGKKIVFDNDD